MTQVEIIDADTETISHYCICGYKNLKQEGYQRKINWLKKRFSEGLKFKVLHTSDDGAIGFIESIPGEYSWRPVDAPGYAMIHCMMIYRKPYKGQGFGSLLLERCIQDAKQSKMAGVAVVTSQDTWMAGSDLFEKHGFESADTAPPSFQLLVKKLKKNASHPKFKGDWEKKSKKLGTGLMIVQSDQCPCIAKCSKDIQECADRFGLKAKVIQLKNCKQAQNTPSAYGIFNIVYNGQLIADHPIGQKRFSNIMTKILN